jgi:mono/diheme cytochrome c family protein
MTRRFLLAGTAIVVVVTSMLLATRPVVHAQNAPKAANTDSAPTGDVQNGKKLFTSYGCYECHGRAAQGGVGPRLGPNPLPFAAFSAYVRHPSGTMPPYTAKVATDHDLADIHAYLASLPASPKAKDIPLLNP